MEQISGADDVRN